MAAKKKATKAKAKPTKAPESQSVSFEDDIPSITREGGKRGSKYDTLLDQIRERAESEPDKPAVASMTFDTQSKATSRYTSLRDAAAKREDAAHWTVATRRLDDEDIRVYVKWNAEPQVEEDES